jgi:hypothetical protein
MVKKVIILVIVVLYLYHLTFNIFLNNYFRLPTPLILGIPLIVFFREKVTRFFYVKEVLWLLIANFLYYYIAQRDAKEFFINTVVIIMCALFFNYFIGLNRNKFNTSVTVFYILLIVSTCILFLNHLFPGPINLLRSQLIGGDIVQSPSGITSAIYNFGYQLAPLVAFLFIFTFAFNKDFIVKGAVLGFCLIAIYFGMQRSVLLTFVFSSVVFFVAYYKYKAIPVIFFVGVFGFLISSFFLQKTSGDYDNIFAKNDRNSEESRSSLVTENLKIYTSYPFGLVFYGKSWSQVTRNNRTFNGGLTSHNAYLMFITYLGPFLGLLILGMIYYRYGVIFKNALFNIRDPENALLICLCFSFLAVSLNSLFHNSWLVGGNGPTLFIYFAILHLNKQRDLIDADRA